MRKITHLVIHCSATPVGRQVTVNEIDQWHKAREFKRTSALAKTFNPQLTSIGYHFVIDLDGKRFTGRHEDEVGAHVAGHNSTSIGVCMVGMRQFTRAQWDELRNLVTHLQAKYPGATVCGHRDFSPDLNGDGTIQPREWIKECPTFDVSTWLSGGLQALPQHTVRD